MKYIENFIDNLDFTEIHKNLVINAQNSTLIIWHDLSIEVLTAGTFIENDSWYLEFKCDGMANHHDYSEGWAKEVPDDYIKKYVDEDGETMTAEEMVIRAIEEGEYNDWENYIRQTIQEDFTKWHVECGGEITAKMLLSEAQKCFTEKFYKVADIDDRENNPNPWGCPWHQGSKVVLDGDTIEKMAVNYYTEVKAEMLILHAKKA